MNDKKISVIMPALNEEKSLPGAVANVLEGFERFSIDGELIIVNDGSSDRTGEIAEGFSDKFGFVHVLHRSAPLGIGVAFRDGLQLASGELVVYIPGDGEIDVAEVFRNIPLMEEVDMVIPYMINLELRSWYRRWLSAIYHQIMTLTFSVSLEYLNGTVLYRRSILYGITIRNPGFFYQAELLIKTINRNYSYVEVPYKMTPRIGGKSKFMSMRTLTQVAKGYVIMINEVYFSKREHHGLAQDSIAARIQNKVVSSATAKHQ